MQTTKEIIQKYYHYFNEEHLEQFITLLDDEVVHDINQGECQRGKEQFIEFMQRMNHHYQEKMRNIVVMVSEDGKHAAAEYIVDGKYLATDAGLPEAKGQAYSLPGGAFFEIKKGKIARVTNYYNLNDWIKQVSA